MALQREYSHLYASVSFFGDVGKASFCAVMSEDMVKDGYEEIMNIDISWVVIDMMRKKYADVPPLTYMQMDVREMNFFPDESFDSVIDKGTLDSLMCGISAPISASQMLGEVNRLLRPGGIFMLPDRALKARWVVVRQQSRTWYPFRLQKGACFPWALFRKILIPTMFMFVRRCKDSLGLQLQICRTGEDPDSPLCLCPVRRCKDSLGLQLQIYRTGEGNALNLMHNSRTASHFLRSHSDPASGSKKDSLLAIELLFLHLEDRLVLWMRKCCNLAPPHF